MERFDYEGRKAYVRRVDSDYFTDAIDYTQVKELEEFESAPVGGASAAHGDVRLNRQIVGFKKVKFYTMENVGAGNLSMPEQEMHTTAFWLHFPEAFLARFADLTPTEKQNGLVGLGALLTTVGSLAGDVRSARSGRLDHRRHRGQSENVSSRICISTTTIRAASGRARALFKLTRPLLEGAATLLRGLPVRSGLPELRRPDRRSRRAGQRNRRPDSGGTAGVSNIAIIAMYGVRPNCRPEEQSERLPQEGPYGRRIDHLRPQISHREDRSL